MKAEHFLRKEALSTSPVLVPLPALLHPGTVVHATLRIAYVEGRSNACLGHQNFNTCLADLRRQEGDKNIEEGKNGLKMCAYRDFFF